MKLTIFGAAGRSGALLTQQALAAGHEVTAVARNPGLVALHNERLRVLQGDVLDPAAVEAAVRGQDAVVSCIGGTMDQKPVTLYSTGTRNILHAMRASGVSRFMCISANPLMPGGGDVLLDRLVLKPIVRQIFKESYADLARMEKEVRGLVGARHASPDLDWTIVFPPRLTDRPPTGRYRVAFNRNLPRGRSLGRADLADAMLTLLDDPRSVHAAVAVAY